MNATAEAAPAIDNQAMSLRRELLHPSPTNPRRARHADSELSYKHWKLGELAASILTRGVMVPLIARPSPHYSEGNGLPPYEIVCGERRWRASEMIELAVLPVVVRPLTDLEVLDLQAVENDQREPLHPLEDAEHYQRMVHTVGGPKSVEDLATRVNKSVRAVQNSLRLLTLGPAARDAFYAGQLTESHAVDLAYMVPNHADQARAVQHIVSGWGGDRLGVRSAREYLRRNFMLRMDAARFSLTSIYRGEDGKRIGPSASGMCTDCPHRTGTNPGLFAEMEDGLTSDMCQQPDCYQAKTAAVRNLLLTTARDEGATVLTGAAARAALPQGAGRPKGYHLIHEPCPALTDRQQSLNQLVGPIRAGDLVLIDRGTDIDPSPLVAVADATARALLSKANLRRGGAAPAPAPAASTPGPQPAPAERAATKPSAAPAPQASKPPAAAQPARVAADPTQAVAEDLMGECHLPEVMQPGPQADAAVAAETNRLGTILVAQAAVRSTLGEGKELDPMAPGLAAALLPYLWEPLESKGLGLTAEQCCDLAGAPRKVAESIKAAWPAMSVDSLSDLVAQRLLLVVLAALGHFRQLEKATEVATELLLGQAQLTVNERARLKLFASAAPAGKKAPKPSAAKKPASTKTKKAAP